MVNNDGDSKRQLPNKSGFMSSNLMIYTTVIRFLIIIELIPSEISSILQFPALSHTLVRYKETRRVLQTFSSFRNLFPTLTQAYQASVSPPLPLVWVTFLVLEKCCFLSIPKSEYGCRILWKLGCLLIDLGISAILERIALSVMEKRNGDWEEQLMQKMPAAIQPPRAHLFQVSRSAEPDQEGTLPFLANEDIPTLTAQLYYASPITILASGFYDSYQNIWCLLLLWSLCEMLFRARQSRTALAALSLALATYGQPWFLMFCVPICLSCTSRKTMGLFTTSFLFFTVGLQCLSFLLVGTDNYWRWNPTLQMTPNLGPLWYFQMQLFDRFHDYYVVMLTGLPYLVVVPLSIRMHRYHIELITCLWFIGTLFQSNPTLYDFNVALCLIVMSPRSLARMNAISVIALSSIVVPVCLYILDYKLWLETGSGNANYIFFQCLAYNAFVVMVFLDFAGATLQRDKALRLTELTTENEGGATKEGLISSE